MQGSGFLLIYNLQNTSQDTSGCQRKVMYSNWDIKNETYYALDYMYNVQKFPLVHILEAGFFDSEANNSEYIQNVQNWIIHPIQNQASLCVPNKQ